MLHTGVGSCMGDPSKCKEYETCWNTLRNGGSSIGTECLDSLSAIMKKMLYLSDASLTQIESPSNYISQCFVKYICICINFPSKHLYFILSLLNFILKICAALQ